MHAAATSGAARFWMLLIHRVSSRQPSGGHGLQAGSGRGLQSRGPLSLQVQIKLFTYQVKRSTHLLSLYKYSCCDSGPGPPEQSSPPLIPRTAPTNADPAPRRKHDIQGSCKQRTGWKAPSSIMIPRFGIFYAASYHRKGGLPTSRMPSCHTLNFCTAICIRTAFLTED